MTTIENFRAAMRTAGLGYVGPLHPDSKLHRITVEGDTTRNSWYVLHPSTPAAGAFGCWKRGNKETWCERSGSVSQTERSTLGKRWRETEALRQRLENEWHLKARRVAVRILERAKPVTAHGYLAAKGVRAFGNIRESRGGLVLPLCGADGQLCSLQFIGADGSKKFLSGGKVAGCFFALDDNSEGPLVVCEGYATGASIHEATGFATFCAMNCGNLLSVTKALRAKWPVREIIVAADDDRWTGGNPGLTKATEAAKAIAAKLAVPQFTAPSVKPTDFNDLHQSEGLDTVKTQLEAAAPPAETDEELFERLGKLSLADYDRARDNEAKQAGVRVGTLDTEVAKRRPQIEKQDTAQGSKISFPDVAPWPQPVNGSELLNAIASILKRFVILPEYAIIACALFVIHSHAFDLGDISPILFITGPTKRCGKSKLLAILLRLVSRPFSASSATPAAIYRLIESHHPTLGIDEVDTFVNANEQLRGLINSGHTRDAAFHLGCATTSADDFEPRRWSTWTPKIFAGIGSLADTIEDRAIIIRMVRRRRDEVCERLRQGTKFEDIPRMCQRFVADHVATIKDGNPSIPDGLNDRAADNWTPMLTLADAAGGDWPAMARQAASALSGGDEGESLGLNGQLLKDIRDIFATAGVQKLTSKDLAERLTQLEARPWAEYGKHRRPISPNQVANLLRDFRVSSRTIRTDSTTAKGYDQGDFSEAFSRYLPPNGFSKGNNVTTPLNIEENVNFQKVTTPAGDVSENAVSAIKDGGCDFVTNQNEDQEALLL